MRNTTCGELTGWLAYLSVDDEVQVQQTALAIVKAFGGGKQTQAKQDVDDEDEEVIDTTNPDFVKQFAGFTGAPGMPQPRSIPQQSTEILLG